MSKGKITLQNTIILTLLLIACYTMVVLAAGTGGGPASVLISPADNSYDADGNITLSCRCEDSYDACSKITPYWNFTEPNDKYDVNSVVFVANQTTTAINSTTTVLASNHGNSSFNLDDYVSGGDSDNATLTWTCLATNNISNTTWAVGNWSVKVAKPDDPVGGDLLVEVASPADHFVGHAAAEMEIKINASVLGGLSVGVQNVTLYYNITTTAEQNESDFIYNDSKIRGGFESWTVDTTQLNTNQSHFLLYSGNFSTADVSVLYYAAACKNTTGGTTIPCNFTSGNFTMSYAYVAEETSVPTFGNPTQTINGSVGDGTLTLGINIADDTNLASVKLYWNQSNASYVGSTDMTVAMFTLNDTLTISGTAYEAWFNYTDMLTNLTNGSQLGAEGDNGWLSWFFEACDNATTANCANSSNFTAEIDTLPPSLTSTANVTSTDECDQINLTYVFGEPSNVSVIWGNGTGVDLRTVTTNSSFGTTVEVSLSPVETYKTYYYNLTACDEHNNCASNFSENLMRFGLSLCDGWSEYSVLATQEDLGQIGANVTAYTGNVSVRWWNRTSASFMQWNNGLVTNENLTVFRGDAVGIWTDEDVTLSDAYWERAGTTGINTTIIMPTVFSPSNWSNFGIISPEGRTFENYTLTEDYNWEGNVTLGTWLNNSAKKHRSWSYNLTKNNNMSLPYPSAVWFWAEAQGVWNRSEAWMDLGFTGV